MVFLLNDLKKKKTIENNNILIVNAFLLEITILVLETATVGVTLISYLQYNSKLALVAKAFNSHRYRVLGVVILKY